MTTPTAQADEKAAWLEDEYPIRKGLADGSLISVGASAVAPLIAEIDRLRAALRPEGEAVAWQRRVKKPDGAWGLWLDAGRAEYEGRHTELGVEVGLVEYRPLYATPPAPAQVEPASEPAGGGVREALQKLYDGGVACHDLWFFRDLKVIIDALSSPASCPAEAEALPDGVERKPYDMIVKRLLNPPFGTETSERLLMGTAADAIRTLLDEVKALSPAPAQAGSGDAGEGR